MTNSLRWITLFIGILVLRPAAAAEPDLVKEALAHFAVRENSRLSHGWLSFSKDMGDVDWQQFEKLKGLKELKGLQLKTGSVTDKDLIHLEGFVGLESLALWDTQVSGSGFKHLTALPNLRNVTLHPFDDQGLLNLKSLPQLKHLNLYGASVTDDGLRQLGEMTGLEALYLSRTKITDTGLQHLTSLRNLRVLGLDWNNAITDAGLPYVAQLENLRELNLTATTVTDIGPLKGLPHLESLDLQGTMMTSDGLADLDQFRELRILRLADVGELSLEHVPRAAHLEKLVLCYSKITDTSLPYLSRLKRLKVLELWETPITDAGIVSLKDVTSLEDLDLTGTGLGDAGMAALAQLPRLKVLNARRTLISEECVPSILKMPSLQQFDPIDTKLSQSQKATDDLRRLRPKLSVSVDAPP